MITTDLSNFYHFYPANVTLVGAQHKSKTNFMAVAWNTGISFDPPLFGVAVSEKRFTHHMIVETGVFTCNFLTMESLELIHACGRVSGRDVDKVQALDIPLEDSRVIPCPTIKTSYAAYECILKDRYSVGDHDLFIGEVVAVHLQPDGVKNRILNPEKLDFSLYMGNNTYISTNPGALKEMPAEITVK